jgi:uncharacterized protein (TIGR02246 family)
MSAKLTAVLAVALLTTTARADDAAEVKAALTKLNAAFAADDADAVRGLMTADHVAVTPYAGRQTLDEQIKALPDGKFTVYETGPMTVRPLADGVALVTYSLTQKGTFRGKAVPPKAYSSAVWVKRDGQWREAYYQETAQEQ